MDVAKMRRVDRWIGAPACAALTLLRRLDDLLLRRRPRETPRRIAVFKLAEQGATVLAYPALDRARAAVGAENLFFVVFAQNRFILDVLGIVRPENVLVIRTTSIARLVLDTLGVVRRMHREKIDTALDFEFFARSSAVLAYLSGARTRVGFHAYFGEASYRGDLMTHRLGFNPFLHASDVFQLLVEAAKLPARNLPACDMTLPDPAPLPTYQAEPDQFGIVQGMIRESLGTTETPSIVLFNANCSDLLPLRRWPPERYVELARALLDRYPEMAIAFTGSPEEAPEAERLVERIASDRCVSFAGRTTLDQLMVLYGLSELLITNDSGPAHYATLTTVDVITLFGPETPAAFGARTTRSHLLWTGLPCSPCVNGFNDRQSACKDNVCMQRIGVDEVARLACRVYESRRSGQSQPDSGLNTGPSAASASSSSGR